MHEVAQARGIPHHSEQRVDFATPGSLSAPWFDVPQIAQFIIGNKEPLRELPETQAVIGEVMREGSVHIPPMMDNDGQAIVPTPHPTQSFVLNKLAFLLERYVKLYGSFAFDEDAFARCYAAYREAWHSELVERTVLVPLLNFTSDVADVPLADGITLTPLTSEDKGRLWQRDPFGNAIIAAGQLAQVQFAIRSTYLSPPNHFNYSAATAKINTAIRK